MQKAEIENRVKELHSNRPIDASLVAEIEKFLESLPPDERLYAAAYGELLAEGKLPADSQPETKDGE